MVCVIIACVVASFFYRKTNKKQKIRLEFLTKVENQLNQDSLANNRQAVYKFTKRGDQLIIYPRDKILEQQSEERKIQFIKKIETFDNDQSQKVDTLSLEDDKQSFDKENDGSINALEELSSIYETNDNEDKNNFKNSVKHHKVNQGRFINRPIHPDVKKKAILDLYTAQLLNDNMLSIITEEDLRTNRTNIQMSGSKPGKVKFMGSSMDNSYDQAVTRNNSKENDDSRQGYENNLDMVPEEDEQMEIASEGQLDLGVDRNNYLDDAIVEMTGRGRSNHTDNNL